MCPHRPSGWRGPGAGLSVGMGINHAASSRAPLEITHGTCVKNVREKSTQGWCNMGEFGAHSQRSKDSWGCQPPGRVRGPWTHSHREGLGQMPRPGPWTSQWGRDWGGGAPPAGLVGLLAKTGFGRPRAGLAEKCPKEPEQRDQGGFATGHT